MKPIWIGFAVNINTETITIVNVTPGNRKEAIAEAKSRFHGDDEIITVIDFANSSKEEICSKLSTFLHRETRDSANPQNHRPKSDANVSGKE